MNRESAAARALNDESVILKVNRESLHF